MENELFMPRTYATLENWYQIGFGRQYHHVYNYDLIIEKSKMNTESAMELGENRFEILL